MNGSDEAPRTGAPETPFWLPLSAGFDAASLALVIEHLRQEQLPAGHVVFADNAPGKTLCNLTSVRILVRPLDNGHEPVFAEMGPREFFGELALLEEKPCLAGILTLTATSLLAMCRQTFNRLIDPYPMVAANFLKVISTRLRERNQTQEMLLQEKQTPGEELVPQHVQLERALAEFRVTMATVAEHERVKRALEIIRQTQGRLLPTTFPHLPGLQLHAMTVPSRSVGGISMILSTSGAGIWAYCWAMSPAKGFQPPCRWPDGRENCAPV